MFVKVLIFAVILFGGAFFLKKRIFPTSEGVGKLNSNESMDAEEITASNSKSEDEYRYKTPEELLEISWQFLEDIAEKVMKKFSATAQKTVRELGKTLFNVGVRYQHVVPNQPQVSKASHGKKNAKQGSGKSY